MKTLTWIKKNIGNMKGKSVAISGATGGLGTELSMHLAGLGADLILLNRSEAKSIALGERIKKRYPHTKITNLIMDLEDATSVKGATEYLTAHVPDALILNAGAYHIPRHVCSTGYDNVFQINCVAPYYLARTLMPAIIAKGGRIVAVSSIAHNYSKIDESDVDFSTRKKPSLVYGNAKRHLTYALLSLFDGTDGLSIAHPGISQTNITAHYPKLVYAIIKYPMRVIFMRPRRACLSVLQGIVDGCNSREWIGPRLFGIWGLPKKKALKTANESEIRRIADIAEEYYERFKNA